MNSCRRAGYCADVRYSTAVRVVSLVAMDSGLASLLSLALGLTVGAGCYCGVYSRVGYFPPVVDSHCLAMDCGNSDPLFVRNCGWSNGGKSHFYPLCNNHRCRLVLSLLP